MSLIKLNIRKLKNIVYAENDEKLNIKKSDLIIIKTENDLEFANVFGMNTNDIPGEKDIYKIVRKATEEDFKISKDNDKILESMKVSCLRKIKEKNLDLKLTSLEFTLNREKLFLYYTADGRVDFRELIKELGLMFKTKIQMVQIGVRDEAKITGGMGHCGRVVCCKGFMNNLNPVVIDMAKDQGLSLNPNKISGLCGRLLCCLSFENEYYKNISKIMPDEDAEVMTEKGLGRVKARHVLKEEVDVFFEDASVKRYNISDVKIKKAKSCCGNGCGSNCIDRKQ